MHTIYDIVHAHEHHKVTYFPVKNSRKRDSGETIWRNFQYPSE